MVQYLCYPHALYQSTFLLDDKTSDHVPVTNVLLTSDPIGRLAGPVLTWSILLALAHLSQLRWTKWPYVTSRTQYQEYIYDFTRFFHMPMTPYDYVMTII